MSTQRRTAFLATALVAAATLVGCSSQSPTRSGGAEKPVTLRITAFTANANTPETTDEFRQRAEAASGGSIRFDRLPNVEVPENQVPDPSSDLIRQVRDGKVDVGVVASRSFDLIGVHSLEALSAPLTVENPDQAVRLLADPVAARMLAGLSSVGLVGLTASWNQLKQPLGYGKAIRTPADLRGAFVIGRRSRVTQALFTAVGATLHLQSNNDDAKSVASGEADAAELSFDHPLGQSSGPDGRRSVVMANVQLSILANVIVVNARTWAGLSPTQRQALQAAANATRDWAGARATTLTAARDRFCADRLGDVAVATPAELAAWRSALGPLVQSLRSADPVTAAVLDRARAIVAEHPSHDLPTPCTAVARTDGALVAKGDQSAVVGVWRMTAHADRLAAAGATDEEVRLNSGTWTFTVKSDGTYGYVEPRGRTCTGRFAIDGTAVTFVEDGGSCDGRWSFTFVRSGNALRLTPTPAFASEWSATNAFFSEPWTRIGDAPAP